MKQGLKLKKTIISERKDGCKIKGIYKVLREFEECEDLSDLSIFLLLIETLREESLPYKNSELYTAFRLVDKDDYAGVYQKDLLSKYVV